MMCCRSCPTEGRGPLRCCSPLFCCVCTAPWADDASIRYCGCSCWVDYDTVVLTGGLAQRLLDELSSCRDVVQVLTILEHWGFECDQPFRRTWRIAVSALRLPLKENAALRKKWVAFLDHLDSFPLGSDRSTSAAADRAACVIRRADLSHIGGA